MKLRTLPVLLLLPLAAHADALYKCTDDEGHVLYTNQKDAAKKCTVLSRELPVSSFKAPKARPNSPGDFPRVSGDQQKARDSDRRAILDQELANEQRQADEARKALAEREALNLPEDRTGGGTGTRLQSLRDTVALHDRNIEALKKEMSNLR